MAVIKNYDPTSLASPLVGTAGVNQSAGQPLRRLAQGIGTVRQQLSNNNKIITNRPSINYTASRQLLSDAAQLNSNAITGTGRLLQQREEQLKPAIAARGQEVESLLSAGAQAVGNIGGAVVKKMRMQTIAQNQQKQMLQTLAVAASGYQAENDITAQRQQIQQDYIDNPEQAPQALQDYMDLRTQAALSQYNDPQAKAKLSNSLLQTTGSQSSQMRNWSFDQQTKQGHELLDKAATNMKQTIDGATGSISQKLQTMRDAYDTVYKLGDSSRDVLGDAFVGQKMQAAQEQAGVSFFQNLVADKKDDPEDQLNYIKQARTALDHSESPDAGIGIRLEPSKRIELNKMFDAAETQAGRDLTAHLEINTLKDDFKIRAMANALDQSRDNAPLQQSAINYAASQTKALGLKSDQIANSNWPDKVKDAYLKTINAQVTRLDGLAQKGNGHLDHQEAEAKADARQAMSDAKAARREAEHNAKQKDSAVEKKAKADLAEQKKQAQIHTNQLNNELFVLKQDPIKNAKAIQDKSKEIYNHAAFMADAGFENPHAAGELQTHALNTGTHAVEMQRNVPLLGHILPNFIQAPVKRQSYDKTIDARSKAAQGISQSVNSIQSMHKQNQINETLPVKMTDHQKSVFDMHSARLRAQATNEKRDSVWLDRKLNMARTLVLQNEQ